MTSFETASVIGYYDAKTKALLRKYGPGPRIHYHCGLVKESPPVGATQKTLRQILLQGQEQLLKYLAGRWKIGLIPFSDVLDVGCGLGGGSIFWAQEYGSSVTAVTIIQSHLDLTIAFSQKAGIASKIIPLLCDAAEVPGNSCFDAAVAIESSCHFRHRQAWFQRVHGLLRPGGRVLIADYLFDTPGPEQTINDHFCANVGTLDEYLTSARLVGLQVKNVEDISQLTANFWKTSVMLLRTETQNQGKTADVSAGNIEKSIRIHSVVERALNRGALKYILLTLMKPG